MELVSGLLAQTQPKPQSAISTIAKLCDRLLHSNLLEDRRAAVLGLKGFSRQYREQVAAGGLRGLTSALQKDNEDQETCRATLETLIILFINSDDEQDRSRQSRLYRSRHKKYTSPLLLVTDDRAPKDDIALWLTDEFTQKEENITALISLLQHTNDFYCKIYALQLLSAIISNRPRRAQECVVASAFGIAALVSCLNNLREAIRNEAILALLSLVNGNADIQKLVAFEGAFDKLFQIVEEEGGLEGGMVVEDCLTLISSLLVYNVSNQVYFRETNCIPKLNDLLTVPTNEEGEQVANWENQQYGTNISVALEICQLFVPEDHEATRTNQGALCRSGMLVNVMRLAFGDATTLSIRSAALLTAADLIQSNNNLQQDFLAIDVPYFDLSKALSSNIPREIQVVPVYQALLNWALDTTSIHAFDLRIGAHACLIAAFKNNEMEKISFIRSQIIFYEGPQSLKNASNTPNGTVDEEEFAEEKREANGVTSETASEDLSNIQFPPEGSANLLSTLLDYAPDVRLNPYKIWFAASILMHIFVECHEVRDLLREVSVGEEANGEELIAAIPAMTGMLVTSLQYQDPRISIAYLMLFSVWLYDDVAAVSDFLQESSTVQSLIGLLTHASNRNPLVEGLSAILLGIIYDFSTSQSPISRRELHSILNSTIGRDQYVLKVQRLKENAAFKNYEPNQIFSCADKKDETGLPELFFDEVYVELVRENISRIQKAFDRDPDMEPNSRISLEMYETLQQQHIDLVNELDGLKKTSEESDAISKARMSELEDELAKSRASIEDLDSKLETLGKENQLSSSNLTAAQSQLNQLIAERQKLEESYKEATDSLQKLTKAFEEHQQKEKHINQQLGNLKKDKEKAENGINKMNRELFALTKSKEEVDKKVSTLEKQIQDLNKKNGQSEAKLTERVNKLTIEKDEKDYKYKGLENELKAARDAKNTLNAKRTQAINELKSLQAGYQELDDLKSALIEKLQSAARNIEDLKSDRDKLTVDLEASQNEVDELKSKVEKVSSEARELEQKHIETEKSNVELRSTLDDHKEQIASIRSRSDTLEKDLSDAEASHSKEREEWQYKIATLEKDQQSIQSKLGLDENEVQRKTGEMQARLAEELEKYKALESKFSETEKSIRALQESNRAALRDAEKEYEFKLQEEIESLKTNQEKTLVSLDSKVAELEAEKERLENELLSSRAETESATMNGKDTDDNHAKEVESLKKAMQAAVTKNVENARKLKQTEEKLEAMKKVVDQAESNSVHLEKKLKGMDQAVKNQEVLEKALDIAKTESEKLVKSSKELACQHAEEIKKIKSDGDNLAKDNAETIKKLENKVKESESKTTDKDYVLRSDFDALMLMLTDLEESKNKYKSRLKELNEAVSEEESEDDDDDDDEEDEYEEEENDEID